MKYIFTQCRCTTCGISFIQLPFIEYRALGFCTETCWKHISPRAMTQQEYAIKQAIIGKNDQAKLDMDFEQRVAAA